MSYITNSIGEPNWVNVDVNIYNIASGSSAPAATICSVITGMKLFGFKDGSSMNEIYATIELPHDIIPNSIIRPHIHWMPHDGTTGNVNWQLAFSIGDDNIPFSPEVISSAVSAALGAEAYTSKEFTPYIPALNVEGGAILMMRLWRDATDPNDTYTGIAKLLSLGIHYQSKIAGSTAVFVQQ